MPDVSEPPKSPSQPVEGVILTPNHSAIRVKTKDDDNMLNRFLGGTPQAVVLRLLMASLIVGFFLVWLDIQPFDIFRALDRLIQHLWDMGFGAVREIGQYILAGAILVVPVWLLSRVLKAGR